MKSFVIIVLLLVVAAGGMYWAGWITFGSNTPNETDVQIHKDKIKEDAKKAKEKIKDAVEKGKEMIKGEPAPAADN